ncbi:hypothetical protein DL98DRAFT_13387 [Cadophora sp. DSE1049]|nr:hypothetical protein DL98DRAFT_13387 [Cadophora sp. DSE1049]
MPDVTGCLGIDVSHWLMEAKRAFAMGDKQQATGANHQSANEADDGRWTTRRRNGSISCLPEYPCQSIVASLSCLSMVSGKQEEKGREAPGERAWNRQRLSRQVRGMRNIYFLLQQKRRGSDFEQQGVRRIMKKAQGSTSVWSVASFGEDTQARLRLHMPN